MNRRVFLGAVGSAASLGTLAYTTRRPTNTLAIRVWLSERAATYDGISDRIREYLEVAFSLEGWALEISFGGTIAVSTEDGARVTKRGEWPQAVLSGAFGDRDIDPVPDVNLLVTDDGMENAPTGYGLPHVASVGGARHLAELAPFDELVADSERLIVPAMTPAWTMQVLIHEAGHALGLEHHHGVAFLSDDAIVATPMLSSYAWDPTYDTPRSQCRTPIPAARERRKISFTFSECSRRELAGYDGGLSV